MPLRENKELTFGQNKELIQVELPSDSKCSSENLNEMEGGQWKKKK
jgi:hypothetical protein